MLIGSVVLAFMGSMAYQARVARPGIAPLPAFPLPETQSPTPVGPASTAVTPIAADSAHATASSSSGISSPGAPAPAAPAPTAALAVQSPEAPERADSSEVPVTVNVRDRRGIGLIDATLYNRASTALNLMLESNNPRTGSSSQITLQLNPAENRRVGQDEGLYLNPGETLTVSSPPYQALRVEVR